MLQAEHHDLTKPASAERLVDAWHLATEQAAQAFEQGAEALKTLRDVFEGGRLYCDFPDRIPWEDPERAARELKAKWKLSVWRAITEQLGVRKFMSEAELRKLDDQLEGRSREPGDQLPEITIEAIRSMAQNIRDQGPQMLAVKIQEVYQRLRPQKQWGGEYKTNVKSNAVGVGKKVILGWMIESGYNGHPFRVRYGSEDRLRAINQVFTLLDKKDPDKDTTYQGALAEAINAIPRGQNTFETPYFRGRCFRNGNLHLEFKRQDLLDRFNLIAGGKNLPTDSIPREEEAKS